MRARGLRGRGLGVAGSAIVPAILLAGCTSTIDNGKAEQAIRNTVDSRTSDKVKSVSCPSGVTAKRGGTFVCQLTITRPNGSQSRGTVTIHMNDNKGHVTFNSSDFHLQ